jgi:NADH:ubiquinone oxidoreductase subunit E
MADAKTLLRYREILKPFQPDRGDLLAALHAIQHEFGYIPAEAVEEVGKRLRMPAATVFGALSFYSEFRTTPPPRNMVMWCSGPACRLKGGDNIRLVLETVLGIEMEGETPDHEVGLHLGQCNGTCECAPQIWYNGRVVGPLQVADAVEIARGLVAGERDIAAIVPNAVR